MMTLFPPLLIALLTRFLRPYSLPRLHKEIASLHQKIDALQSLLILKEIAPDSLELLKTPLFPLTPEVREALSGTWDRHASIAGLHAAFTKETEQLLSAVGHMESDIPLAAQRDLFLRLMEKDTAHKAQTYHSFIMFQLLHGDTGKDTEALFAHMEAEPQAWEIMTRESWLWNISYRLLQGDRAKAEVLLQRYVRTYRFQKLHSLLSVAHFARACGYRSSLIDKSADIFHLFQQCEEEQFFSRYLQGKRVAVVGNAPVEQGSGNGAVIDSYDVVIRFNTIGTCNPPQDYGQKLSVISKNISTAHDLCKENVEVFFLMDDINVFFLNKKTIHALDYYRKNSIPLVCYPTKTRYQLEQEIDIHMPTSGLRMLYLVMQENQNFSLQDCFGFSFNMPSKPGPKQFEYTCPVEPGFLFRENLAKEFDAVHALFSERLNTRS